MTDIIDVVVIGGGIAGYVAAIESAKFGLTVSIVDDASETAIQTIQLGSVCGIDAGAESFAPGDAIDALCQELGVSTEVLLPRHTLLQIGSVIAPLPGDVIAGIPSNPFAADLAAFSPGSTIRAYADRVMPFLKVRKPRQLSTLVAQRMGSQLLERFTNPYCHALYGISAAEVDIDRVAPKLNANLTLTGSLSGAVLALSGRTERQLRVRDGLASLQHALRRRARDYAVNVIPARARNIEHSDDLWRISFGDQAIRARTVLAAIDPATVGQLRAEGVAETARAVRIHTALVRVEGVSTSNAPVATGVLSADDSVLLSAARPASRSEHLGSQLPAGSDLIRVVQRVGEDSTDALPAVESVISRAATSLGIAISAVDAVETSDWSLFRPWVGLDDPEVGQRRSDPSGSLEWTGQWTSGSGLARVAQHAHDAAHRVRVIAVERRLASNA